MTQMCIPMCSMCNEIIAASGCAKKKMSSMSSRSKSFHVLGIRRHFESTGLPLAIGSMMACAKLRVTIGNHRL